MNLCECGKAIEDCYGDCVKKERDSLRELVRQGEGRRKVPERTLVENVAKMDTETED